MNCTFKQRRVSSDNCEVESVHVFSKLFRGDVEGRFLLLDVEVAHLILKSLVEHSEGDVEVRCVEVGVEKSPAVGHIPTDIFAAVEEGIILDWTHVGKHIFPKIASITLVSDITLVEESKGEHILLFFGRKHCFLFLVIDNVKASKASDKVGEGDSHCVVVVEKHPWRLVVLVLFYFDTVSLPDCEKTVQKRFLIREKTVEILVAAH